MSAPPYMNVYIADYTADVQALTCEQDGAYWRLLRAMWRAGGKLPNTPAKLATITGLPLKRWQEIGPDVLELFERRGGALTHKRLTLELRKIATKSEVRSEAGKKGAAKKANKYKQETAAFAEPLLKQKPSISELEPELEDGGGVGREGDWPLGDVVKALVEATASPWLDPAKSPGLITTSGRLAAWRRDGATWEHDVLPVVAGLCAGQRSPISTWKFFDAAVARSISENRAALAIPAAPIRPAGAPTSFAAQAGAEQSEARRLALAKLETAHG